MQIKYFPDIVILFIKFSINLVQETKDIIENTIYELDKC